MFIKTITAFVVFFSLTAAAQLPPVAAPTGNATGVGNTTGTQNAMTQAMMARQAEMAKQAASAMAAAQMMAMIVGMANLMMCMQPSPPNCVLAGLAFAQAGSLGGTSAGATNTGIQASSGVVGPSAGAPKTGAPGGGLSTSEVKKILADKGVKMSEDGKMMTLPNGQSVPINADSVAEAGKLSPLTDKQLADGKAALNEAMARLDKSKSHDLALDSGAGGPPASGAPAEAPKEADGKSRKSASLSGLSKNFGGDKIGIATDNIFEMITRRYKAFEASDTFIKQ